MTQTPTRIIDHGDHVHELPILDDGSPPLNPWFSAQRVLLYFVIGIVLIWLASGFYRVGVGDVALVQRLGKFLTTANGKPLIISAGSHYHLPWPIDKVFPVQLQREQNLIVRDFHISPAANAPLEHKMMQEGMPRRLFDAIYNPYLITGDENVIHASITVQYRISDPYAYLTSVYQPATMPPGQGRLNMLMMIAAHQLILKIAQSTVDQALYSGKTLLNQELFSPAHPDSGIQGQINKLGLGVQLEKVQLKNVSWPQALDGPFTAVLNARQQEASEIQTAKRRANQLITLAQGNAQATINQATAAANQVLNQAQGEALAFSRVYTQYLKSPRVITYKLLSDTLGKVMQNAARVFFVRKGQRILISLPPPPRKIIIPASR